jgi:hypothetical protein
VNKKLNNKSEYQLRSLASRIANHDGAMTAEQLAKFLNVSRLTVERREGAARFRRFALDRW